MKEGFIREVYLRSTPSVDLELVPDGEQVDCTKHTILMSVYERLLDEYCETQEERTQTNMWMLLSGPQLVRDPDCATRFKYMLDGCGADESDDEIRTLTAIIENIDGIVKDGDLWDYVKKHVSEKFRKEWYRNYLGTKKVTFDGPDDSTEDGIISDKDISDFIGGCWDEFLRHRLMTGHTGRQDRFTQFIRGCPAEVLSLFGDGLPGDAIPYLFYEGLAKGGEYELYGCTKEEFIDILRNKTPDEKYEDPEYAAVLEGEYGIDYAVKYLLELDYSSIWEYSEGTAAFILSLLSKAVEHEDYYPALMIVAHYRLFSPYNSFNVDVDRSIELYSRLATMWKKGLISDYDWIEDDIFGLASVFQYNWGDDMWEEENYPECPDEDVHCIWLLKLLESDFAYDIAGYLKPYLELVLEREENHDWENGKKAIRAFLERTHKDGSSDEDQIRKILEE